ncbi:MAG TPA: MFS transporter [Candidatus Acidoferrum sp.]|jgi:MFS family permease|nr:MFS transporter [Candidatus Acidoferrum sp.]
MKSGTGNTGNLAGLPAPGFSLPEEVNRESLQVVFTAFVVLFCIVGMALWGLPFYYDFMVEQFGWTRAQVTSGNALSKLVVGPLFGFVAGWMIDRFGPRRLMMAGVLMAGVALIGLGSISTLGMFYFFYMFNALGYVCGGPLPNQVLLSRWFQKSRGKAMGFAYLGIGLGGAAVPWISHALVQHFGWQAALRTLGLLIVLIAFPAVFLAKEPRQPENNRAADVTAGSRAAFAALPFYLLTLGSMLSIAAVSGTQQNLKLFLSLDLHFTQNETARVLSLVLTFSIAGRLLMGWLADRFAKKYVMLLIYLLVAAAIPILFIGQSHAAVYAFALIFGIGLGGDYMIVPLVAAEIFGIQRLGLLLGVIITVGGIAEAVSPWLVGHLRDTTGSYTAGFLALICMGLLSAGAAAALPGKQKSA